MEPFTPAEIAATRDLIARRAKAARLQVDLSQPQVAARIDGLSRGMLTEIETGRRKLAAIEALQLARLYGVPVSWLCGAPDLEDSTPELSGPTTEETRDLQTIFGFLRYRRRQERGAGHSAPR